MKRDLEVKKLKFKTNPLWYWHKFQNPFKVIFNYLIISICRMVPVLSFKNFLYRRLGVKIGDKVSIGLEVTLDIFFPELIEIQDNTIIGFGSVILTHEFLRDEFRKGKVRIGKNVMIGARTTVLPGVEIGDGAVVSANSLVNRDVKSGEKVFGVPIQP